ncbi:MAG: hypothetical protein GXX85_01155 [Ignavibacteria bacterium]|nr:hypothetical protein [Ignavibacteria bacterium]
MKSIAKRIGQSGDWKKGEWWRVKGKGERQFIMYNDGKKRGTTSIQN